MRRFIAGWPVAELGVHLAPGGAFAAIPAPGAEAVEICVFEAGRETRHRLGERVGDVFQGMVPLAAGAHYGLRAHGAGFFPEKLLLDPWARRLDRPFTLHAAMFAGGGDSAAAMPKAVLEAPLPPLAPFSPPGPVILYELHVRGFTMRHPAVPEALRGTFSGLAHPAAIAHLLALGVTHVELLPCAAWVDERHLPPLGLSNYWGYNPVGFLAPEPRLAPGGMAEVRACVAALREAGIRVILDIVLNHSGEGDAQGPILSLRGLGEAHWYAMRHGALENHAGTGNVLALDQPWPLRLAMDALRHWAEQTGIAGFRLDLATTLGRSTQGFTADAPLLLAMRQDPVLRRLLIIAEPWDIGPDGYQLGGFPAGWPEWNDRFRDDTRRFWRGDAGCLGDVTTRFAGSADLFTGRPASDSLNFITAHDGFTLADLVSHERRHNHANGEENRDGGTAEIAWNHGVEGPSEHPGILAARAQDARALLLLLLTARGTPMLAMGDELGRSQGGNNNAYCQDNALSWLDWPGDAGLAEFTGRLVRARKAHPALHAARHLSGAPKPPGGLPDVAWAAPDGGAPDWQGQALVALLSEGEDRVAVAFNAGHTTLPLQLPEPRPGHAWRLLANSAAPEAQGSPPASLPGRAALLLAETRTRAAIGLDDATLLRLASQAGIATDWHDVTGRHTQVPAETLRAVLTALDIPHNSTDAARDSLRALAMPPALPMHADLTEGQPGMLLLGPELAPGRTGLEVVLEDGSRHAIAAAGEAFWHALPDGRQVQARWQPIPALPAGHHRLQAGGHAAPLIVAPARAFMALERPRFGLTAQSYALRHAEDQGIGDYTALAMLAAEAGAQGARLLGLSPPHALMPQDRDRASPYQPSDRRFLEPVLIDLNALPARPGTRAALAAEEALFQALRGGALVDYPQVWAAKRRVLAAAFAEFPADDPGFAAFIAAGGAALEGFASFTALAEQHDGTPWPPGLGHVGDHAVAGFQAASRPAIRFQQFLQFLADAQLARAGKAGAGLYRDLAVGSAPDGAEPWCAPEAFLRGFSLGAPPDPLGPQGQVWGLPAPRPAALPAHFRGLLAANMRHAQALRIDHVMGLQRLFLVPDGAPGAAGCYLQYPRPALLAELTLASQRQQCMVVGEDLGTVPEGLGEALEAANILSYRVLWFERQADGALRPPAHWTRQSAACVSTHDLPTLAGWWEGADIAERMSLGLAEPQAWTAREAERQALLEALGQPDGITSGDAFSDRLAALIHAHVAAGASLLMLVQAEDLAGETMAVNLPGTDRERPNWRRRLGTALPGLCETPRAKMILAEMRGRLSAW